MIGKKSKELQKWVNNLCGGDLDCIKRLKYFIKTSEGLPQKINRAYEEYRNIQFVQQSILDFISKENIVLKTCTSCQKKNLFSNQLSEQMVCDRCQSNLDNVLNELEMYPISKENEGECIYCKKRIFGIANAFTCYTCRKEINDYKPWK